MHTFRARSIVVLSLTGVMILSAGCEDSAAKQRDDVRVQLTKIRKDLESTMARGGDSYQQDLSRIVTELGTVSGGEPGQQSAKSLLAANALRELAMVHINTASNIESEHRSKLVATNARINAAVRIGSLASGLESLDAQRRRAELQDQLSKAMAGVTTAQAKIAELESPINERTTQNQTQKAEIERLRMQVGDLMRQAQAAGYAAGLETFKQATQINRQADRIEFEVSNREIDLEHDLSPQHKMAQTQKAQLEAMSRSIEAAQAELDAFGKAAQGDAQASRAKVAELSKEVNDRLGEVNAAADGALKTAYEDALAALDRASTNARSAAAGAGADAAAAKTMSASLLEMTARVHLSAANGIADRLATLSRIKASNSAIKVDGVDAKISELSASHKTHVDAARLAIDEAVQAAEGISGNSAAVAGFKSSLQALSTAMGGAPAQAPADTDAPAPDAPAPDAPAPDAPAPDAAASPDGAANAPATPATDPGR